MTSYNIRQTEKDVLLIGLKVLKVSFSLLQSFKGYIVVFIF